MSLSPTSHHNPLPSDATASGTPVRGRFFLVGCERSGTTLLQAMLTQHSSVYSFPESHVFCRIVPRKGLYRRLGLANPRTAAPVIHELAERCLERTVDRGLPTRSMLLHRYAKAFSGLVDDSAVAAGCSVWVEKTPHHLFQVAAINRLVPGVRFIHILRDGRDVTASIRDASLEDRGYWGEWSVSALAKHWNRSILESKRYLGDPSHLFVSYEALLDDPATQLQRVCGFIEIPFESAMLRHWESAVRVTGWMSNRPWMDKTHGPVQDTRLKKYENVFTPEERTYLEEHLLGGGQIADLVESAIGHPYAEVA